MTPALEFTNDFIPITYIITNSKTIITPNKTPNTIPDLAGDILFSIRRSLF
jgi:hypothetical protein